MALAAYTKPVYTANPVGAAEGCDLLILIEKKQSQKIAAFGSSYRDRISNF
jgi:hypothetical protein